MSIGSLLGIILTFLPACRNDRLWMKGSYTLEKKGFEETLFPAIPSSKRRLASKECSSFDEEMLGRSLSGVIF